MKKQSSPKKSSKNSSSAANDSSSKKKLTLEEKQEINLLKHRMRLAAKKELLKNRSEENFYCTNKQLLEELEKWRDSNIEEEFGVPKDEIDYSKRTISPELCQMIMFIAKKLTNHSNFVHYSPQLKEDMVSTAVQKILFKGRGLSSYNFKFSNPFAYFTTAIWNTFLIVLRDHYKQENIKKDYIRKQLTEIQTLRNVNQKNLYNDFVKQWLGEDLSSMKVEQEEKEELAKKKKKKIPFGKKKVEE